MNLISQKTKGLVFFIGETVQSFGVYIFALAALWLWIDANIGVKLLFTIFIILNYYNIAKHFIYLRYSMWKENLEEFKL